MFVIEKIYYAKKKIKKFYKDYFTTEGTYTSILPDKIYLKKLYKERLGKKLNLRHPETFTEKLNWLKLYDRRPEYTMMVDKYAVREFVREKIGEEYLVPLIGVWDCVDDIDFDSLPNQFVLKCNHDNGVIICKDKTAFDVDKAKKDLLFHYNRNYYKKLREWPYKNVPRKIICEKYMESTDKNELSDFRFFCLNGDIRFVLIRSMIGGDLKEDIYDSNWNHLDVKDFDIPSAGDVYPKPKFFEELLDITKKLASTLTEVRVDYNIWNNEIFFGELTFFPLSGAMAEFYPEKWNYLFGKWLSLPKKKTRGIR